MRIHGLPPSGMAFHASGAQLIVAARNRAARGFAGQSIEALAAADPDLLPFLTP